MRLRSLHQRQYGLRTLLIVPVIALVLLSVFGLVAAEELAARHEASTLLERRAETVVAGISARLADRQRAKEIYVTFLARERALPVAIEQANVPALARILVPIKSSLGLGFIRVYDATGRLLLPLGEADDEVHAALIPSALAGMTPSTVTVGSAGLQVVGAGPVKGASGIVGAVVVGSVHGDEQLAQYRDSDDVELLASRHGAVYAATSRDGRIAETIQALGLDAEHGGMLTQVASRLGFQPAVRRLDDESCLIALVPTGDIVAASQQRSTLIVGGLAALAGLLTVGGLGIARLLSAPLNALMAAAAGIKEGKYDRRVEQSRIREFDVVGGTMNDLSAQVEHQLIELTHRAFYDRLTDLPNRALLKDRLRIATARAKRRSGHVALMFLDLDNFKHVNDSLGHEAGDALLIALADRLRRSVRPEDTVARLGGDEFVVLIDEVLDEEDAREIAGRILDQLALPYQVDGRELFAMSSIGIAIGRSPDDGPEDLMRNADVAMYQAKSRGKARCVVFEPSMNEHAADRLALETDLRGALDRGEMRVVYQPIVRIDGGEVIEVEALVRWDHPTRGALSPVQFIPIAEETGLIVPLGAWVLQQAAQQARSWELAHPSAPITLSVNLSARQFQEPTLVADVTQILRETGLDARRLKLEITESVMMHDVDAAVTILDQLKRLGIKLAIDDFGTGYSSLAQLRRLPVDILKIDRAFISRLEEGPEDEAVVRSIVGLAESLNLIVTGEGIETAQQAGHLRALGCAQGQGYFYARPLTADAIDRILSTDHPVLPSAAGYPARMAPSSAA